MQINITAKDGQLEINPIAGYLTSNELGRAVDVMCVKCSEYEGEGIVRELYYH